MAKSRWFYDHDGLVGGPISVTQLRQLAASGQLLPTDKVRKNDMDRWVKAQAVKGLFAAEADGGPAPESGNGETIFDFFGAVTPPASEPEPADEPPNPAFDFFGTASFAAPAAPTEVEQFAASPPPARKPSRPRKTKAAPSTPAAQPAPADDGSFRMTAEVPFAEFTAEVPMAVPAVDEEVPFAGPASGVGLAPPPLVLSGAEVVVQSDGSATATDRTTELSVSGGWLTARCGEDETHVRLGRLDAVALRGTVLSVHAGGQSVAVRCDDTDAARTFMRRLLAAG